MIPIILATIIIAVIALVRIAEKQESTFTEDSHVE